MCTQSVGLLAGALEAQGIATVCVALLRDAAVAMRIPRALAVPFGFGRPLGGEGALRQHQVIGRALELLADPGPGPVLIDFPAVDPERNG
jgi:hypothetical protein